MSSRATFVRVNPLADAPLAPWRPPRALLVRVRCCLLALGALLAYLTGTLAPNLPAIALLGAVTLATSLRVPEGLAERLQPVAGGLLTALVLTLAAPEPLPLLPYLLAPVVTAGLVGGIVTAVTTATLATGTELGVALVRGADALPASVAESIQWIVFTLATGGLAAWVRHVQSRPAPGTDPTYVAAYRLLSELRLVSRQLSAGLDAVTLGAALLETLHEELGFDRGACLARPGEGARLVPLARHGLGAGTTGIDEWAAGLDDAPEVTDAWVESHHQLVRVGAGTRAVLLVRVGVRMVGVVVLEWDGGGPNRNAVARAQEIASAESLRLETALLFAEVRSIATAEERRRVAREIHDGIAQELASLGYLVDDATQRADDPDLRERLRKVRSEVSRITRELRLSIHDLRSEVHGAGGLGAAVSDYVRQVGATSALTVHVELDESPARLPLPVESELFRIVQEAVTNARRHAGATNLWVRCHVSPPSALIVVEDDGGGLSVPRQDSYGLSIMRERAEHVGAVLRVEPRPAGGTRVVCELGTPTSTSSRTPHVKETV